MLEYVNAKSSHIVLTLFLATALFSANSCVALPLPFHGNASLLSGVTGDRGTYSCNPGYDTHDPTAFTCSPTGQWSISAPTCFRKYGGCFKG